jgi:hypothetical protein
MSYRDEVFYCPPCRYRYMVVHTSFVPPCGQCGAPMRLVSEQPAGSCELCWQTDPSIRFLHEFGERGLRLCAKCVPLRWYERVPLLDGKPAPTIGESIDARVCALFDELEVFRACLCTLNVVAKCPQHGRPT